MGLLRSQKTSSKETHVTWSLPNLFDYRTPLSMQLAPEVATHPLGKLWSRGMAVVRKAWNLEAQVAARPAPWPWRLIPTCCPFPWAVNTCSWLYHHLAQLVYHYNGDFASIYFPAWVFLPAPITSLMTLSFLQKSWTCKDITSGPTLLHSHLETEQSHSLVQSASFLSCVLCSSTRECFICFHTASSCQFSNSHYRRLEICKRWSPDTWELTTFEVSQRC